METTPNRWATTRADRIRQMSRKVRLQGPEISGVDTCDHIKGGAPVVGFVQSGSFGRFFVSARPLFGGRPDPTTTGGEAVANVRGQARARRAVIGVPRSRRLPHRRPGSCDIVAALRE
jgi:hypothetical protein